MTAASQVVKSKMAMTLSVLFRRCCHKNRPALHRVLSTASSCENPDNADIVISGGGMVGASMACALGWLVFAAS